MSRLSSKQRAEIWAAIVGVAPTQAEPDPPRECLSLDAETLDEIARLWQAVS